MTLKRSLLALAAIVIWQSASAQTAYFGQNKVQYRNFDWYYIQTSNFDIYFYKGEDTLAVFAANALEKAYLQVKEELNHDLTERVPIIIYASHNEFQQTNVISELIPEGVGGFTEVFKNRIVIPFTGSYEDFRHVLHHELTHAVVFNLLYGNALRSIFSREALFSPPLWFSEGYAEYSSRHGWDLEADMFARDAITEGYMPPIEYLNGYLAYKGGQSVINFIVEKYGKEKIYEILNKGRVLVTMDRAVKAALGVSMEDLSDEWQKALKRTYWPEIAKRKEPGEVAKALTDHKKDHSVYNQKAEWSPQGDRLAFFSDRSNPENGYSDRYTDIYVISAIDGSVITRLVSAERSGDLESLHSYYSGLAWSPDGSRIAFVSKSHGKDVIYIVEANNGDRKKKITTGLSSTRNPSWSPDGSKLAFEGINNGFTDLYIYDFEKDSQIRLMHDKYDDNDPSWSPDGRYLAFASDRPVDAAAIDTGFTYGNYNIFLMDTVDDSIKSLTDNPYKNNQPAFSPDGERIAFISNRNGIDNIYIYEMQTAEVFPVTDIISGAFSPSWSPDGDKIAFTGFNKFGFDIFILKDLKNVAPENNELTLTPYMKKLRSGDKNIFVQPVQQVAEKPTVEVDSLKTESEEENFSTYVFQAGKGIIGEPSDTTKEDTTKTTEIAEAPPPEDTLRYLLPDGSYRRNKYKLKFAPELITGGFSYDNFYGLQGQSFLAISDIFGNHHFYIYTDLVNTIDQSNFQLSYAYTPKRIDYAAGIFHFKNIYYDDYLNSFFSDRVYGAQAYASYPFSKFSRLDLTGSQITVTRDVDLYFTKETTNLLLTSLEYVDDSVIWGIVGPVAGKRYKISLEKSFKTVSSGLSFTALEFDYRKYWYFWGRYNLAMRLGGGGSIGSSLSNDKDAKRYHLGGSSNWIGPKRATSNIYSIKDIYVNEIVVPLRGYSYFEDTGTHYGIFNLEFRYPFIDYFQLHFPLPIVLQQVSGAIFWDMGAAWNYNKELRIFDDKKGFPVLGSVKGGFGFGARANLGIFVLRVDLAWATNLSKVAAKPQTYFSFGSEF